MKTVKSFVSCMILVASLAGCTKATPTSQFQTPQTPVLVTATTPPLLKDRRLAFFSSRYWWDEDMPDPMAFDVYTVRPDGTDLTRVSFATKERSCIDSFSWSPNRQWISYEYTEDIYYCVAHYGYFDHLSPWDIDIYIVARDGSQHRKVTKGKMPLWSKDSSEILFICGTDPGLGICIIDVNNKNALPRQLVDGIDMRPIFWSPNGKLIAFYKIVDHISKAFVVNIDGTGLKDISINPDKDSIVSWSPNGLWLLVNTELDGQWDFIAIQPDHSIKLNLTHSPMNEWLAKWSSDSTQLIYQSSLEGENADIYSVNVSDTRHTIRNLTQNPAMDTCPILSPDGSWIAFLSNREGKSYIYTLYKMKINGEEQTKLSDLQVGGEGCQVSWSPDSKWIAFQYHPQGSLNSDEIYMVKTDGSGELINLTDHPADSNSPKW